MADFEPLVPPAHLRAAIAADLRAVTPLGPPAARIGWIVPVAIALLFCASLLFGVRRDALELGPLLSWGASTLEMVLALTLVAAALREAVPGTTLSRRAVSAAVATAVVAVVSMTLLTWSASQTPPLHDPHLFVWRICFLATFVSSLAPLAVSAWLVSRAWPLRPALAGALYGLGSGLMADAGWRLFCHFADPAHVFGAHIAAVAAVTAAGAALSTFAQRAR
jgi:hypothetical protein